jgi:hypothetical protein
VGVVEVSPSPVGQSRPTARLCNILVLPQARGTGAPWSRPLLALLSEVTMAKARVVCSARSDLAGPPPPRAEERGHSPFCDRTAIKNASRHQSNAEQARPTNAALLEQPQGQGNLNMGSSNTLSTKAWGGLQSPTMASQCRNQHKSGTAPGPTTLHQPGPQP